MVFDQRVVFVLVVVLCVGTVLTQSPITVQTASGPVTGQSYSSYNVWKGIPYAVPPVGSNRWQPPVPATPWTTPFQATEFGAGCPQKCVLPPLFCPANTSEDCLHLNVWTPADTQSGDSLPVMIFFAGGAFFQGDGATPIYYGDYFVNNSNVVLVTCSYRLGALGFLVTDQIKGNFGIQDQRLVMQWVQTNIKYFGGNPNMVTIFGESAGAQSVGAHVTSPLSQGLFHKAIMESNPFALEFKTSSEALQYGDDFINVIGCGTDYDAPSVMSCLLSKTADEVVTAQNNVVVWPDVFSFNLSILLPWMPTIDGTEIPMDPMDAFIQGQFNKEVPLLMGTNANEGIMFVWQALASPGSDADYYGAILAGFRDYAARVLIEYPINVLTNDTRPDLSIVVTEYLFGCATRRVAEAAVSNGVPVWLYYYNHPMSFWQAYGPHYEYCRYYACHGTELAFLFHTATNGGFSYTSGEQALSQNMLAYWTNFAKSPISQASPNYGGGVSVQWPNFDPSSDQEILLDVPVSQQNDILKSHCDFWDKIGYNF